MHRETATPRSRHPVLTGVVVVLALATVAGLIALWPGALPKHTSLTAYEVVYSAKVTEVNEIECIDASGSRCLLVDMELLEGPEAGTRTSRILTAGQAFSDVAAGDEVVVGKATTDDPGYNYAIVDRERKNPLLWLFILFAVTVIALGRLRGVAALAGLAVSVGILVVFIIPAILTGADPLTVAIVGASAIAFLSLYFTHGFQTMTSVALIGTLGGLAVTAVLASVFTELTHLTGLVSDEAFFVQALGFNIDLSGLILAGIVIGGLGVIDDATVTQAAAVWELSALAPGTSRRDLVRRGLRIGSSHIASMVNTLVLAYAGAAMPVIVLLVVSTQAWADVANGEVIATEIVRTLVGSIGLVASVPITTWLAAAVRPTSEDLSHTHGVLPDLAPET